MTLVGIRPRGPRIGPGPGSVAIEVYAPAPASGRWDRAAWDGAPWGAPSWQRVECELTEATFRYGVTDETGLLSVPDSGPCDLDTFDPDRTLDPSNPDSPFFGYIGPGTPIRVRKIGATAVPAWAGYIDEATYDVKAGRGRIRCVDGIAYLAQADIPAGTTLPNTLRARVRAIVQAVGLTSIVPVVPEVVGMYLLQESFEDPALPGWGPAGAGAGSGSIVDPLAPQGGRVLSVIGGAGPASYRRRLPATVVPGGVYTMTGYIARPVGTATASLVLWGRGAADEFVTSASVAPVGPTDGTYERLSVTYTAPAAGTVAYLEVWCQSSTLVADKPRFDMIEVIGPDPSSDLGVDPPVAPWDSTQEATAWSAVLDASQDALVYVWLGPAGTLRFTSWGAFPDADISIGCGDPAEGPWVESIETIDYTSAAAGIRNQVRAWTSPNVATATRSDLGSVNRYGGRLFAADRVVPSFPVWADRILADRAGAGLAVDLGTVRPMNEPELDRLLGIGVTGPCIIRVRDDSHPPVIDQDVSVVGALVRVTEVGWSFEFTTTIPRVEWESVDPTPPIPPEPPVGSYHTETRTYVATSDALVALTSGGAQYGAGAATSLPVGAYQGWTYRSLVQFPSIPWTKVRAVKTATLKLQTSTQVRVGFGSSPTIELRRITGTWSAGSSSSPSSGNAVVYPGPSTTTTGAVRSNVTGSQSAAVAIRIDAIARAWAPTSVGGSGAAQRGVALYGGSGSTADTTEFWPVEKGGSARPTLELVVEVFD